MIIWNKIIGFLSGFNKNELQEQQQWGKQREEQRFR